MLTSQSNVIFCQARQNAVVRIDKRYIFALCSVHAAVSGNALSLILFVYHAYALVMQSKIIAHFARLIGAAVVHLLPSSIRMISICERV